MHELNSDKSSGIEIYAELSKKQFNLIQNGDATIEVPYGVSMKNKAGSRALHFYCDDDDAAEELREGLNESGMSWQ